MPKSKRPKKWTKEMWATLARTNYDDLVKTFPDFRRRELLELRKFAKEENPQGMQKTAGELAEEASAIRSAKRKASEATKAQSALLDEVDRLRAERDAALALSKSKVLKTVSKVRASKRGREATALANASDWHCEEPVRPGQVGGMNEFNLDIFASRADWFFRNLATLIKKERQAIAIPELVLALSGDLISGTIHDDLMEGNLLGPIDAIILVKATIAGGIQYLLKELHPIRLTLPCSSGNHGRMTKKRRIATEQSNSLEYFMYASLAEQFKGNKNVRFILPEGYHTYLDIYDYTCRFHHGHALRFNGGVGGITIPVNKKIAAWNRVRKADYDFFGHFHNFLDGGHWVCNGSLIGYGAFSNEIAAPFERPQQSFCLIDKDHGKTVTAPILLQKV